MHEGEERIYEDIFFDNLIFEGTEEEAKEFKDALVRKFIQVNDALKDVYFIRPKDTPEEYFNNLKVLNPVIYSFLCELKEFLGESFVEFLFYEPNLQGISVKVYKASAKRGTKIYTLGYLFLAITHNLKTDCFKMEP